MDAVLTRTLRFGLWYVVWVHVALGCFLAYQVLAGGLSRAEPPFTRDQRAQLIEEYRGGRFLDDSHYQWCSGQGWWVIDSRGDRNVIGGGCVQWK